MRRWEDALQLTGNPFVDTGLMVLSVLNEEENIDKLTLSGIQHVFGDGQDLARYNLNLKCFTMVFGTNGPLTQPAYIKIKKNKEIYLSIVRQLLEVAKTDGTTGPRCDLTGIRSNLDFHAVCSRALGEAGLSIPERKWLGRDWIPLGGSLGNDAQALPAASRPLHVSALALFALQYIPLGVFLLKGKLACPQSTEGELSYALIADTVKNNQDRINLGQTEILGKGEGSAGALERLMRCFEELSYKPGTEALFWLFSNSGAGADCFIEEVPDVALAFIAKAAPAFGSEVRRLLKADPKDSRTQLFECIRGVRDYPSLYAFKKHTGASAEFYEFYQRELLGASEQGLNIARQLAFLILAGEPKRLKEITKPEFLKDQSGKNFVRAYIAHHLTPGQYDALFPSLHHPIRVEPAAWRWLRYYLSSPLKDNRPLSKSSNLSTMTTHPKIIQLAETYRDTDPAKIKNLLDRMTQRKIGVRWLQDKFCLIARTNQGWNLGTWDEFVQDEDGKVVTFELLFQFRLYLSNLYREVKAKGEVA